MIPFFAQTEYTPPVALASWLECAFWLAAFVAAIAVAYSYLFVRAPQPTPMTKIREFDATVADLVKRKFIGEEKDRLTRKMCLFIKGAGRTYLRDRE